MREVSLIIIGGGPLRLPTKDPGMDWNFTKFDLNGVEIGACAMQGRNGVFEKLTMIGSVTLEKNGFFLVRLGSDLVSTQG